MKLFSSAFSEGEMIPVKFTCDGANISPPLEWADLPDGTQSLVLIVDDPDAPRGLFLHWLLYDVPAIESGVTEGVGVGTESAGGGKQGPNGFGKLGYGGPCPPGGTHRYFFHLFALDMVLGLPGSANRARVEQAMQRHVLGKAELMGRYTRARRQVE